MAAMTFPPMKLARIVEGIEAGVVAPAAPLRLAMERIVAIDREIGAFVRLAPDVSDDALLAVAGPLRGVPLGVKDIFDTADMATEHGSPIYAGHRPRADAALVAAARAKGATVVGKTATTEFAYLQPARTRNPRDIRHTPGGSSSGSAAAVAAGMVAGAFGSQTAGSIIRPASFCGIAGFKPSFRLLPTVGMKPFSWSLDTAGLFAAGVEDVALLAALVSGRDLAVATVAPSALRIGVYRSAVDGRLDADMAKAIDETARRLGRAGATVVEVAEPAILTAARDAQRTIQFFEAAQALAHERRFEATRMSATLLAALDEGAAIPPEVYDDARRAARNGRRSATILFEDVDALIAPSALGAAPDNLVTTGDSVINKLWTLTGNPCVSVPGLETASGLPLGISVITRFGRDRDALTIAAWIEGAFRRLPHAGRRSGINV